MWLLIKYFLLVVT